MSENTLAMLLGGALGDSAGSKYEGLDRPGDIHPLRSMDFHSPTFSDDTQLTLATCEALVANDGRVDPEQIAKQFVVWYRQRRLTGLGASTLKALRDLDAGSHWALSGAKGERAAGNGAAMRIAPLALVLEPDEPDSRRVVRDTCRITHHNEEAYVGALAVVLAISVGQNGSSSLLADVALRLPDSVTRDRLNQLSDSADRTIEEVASVFGASGYVAESVPLALFAVTCVDPEATHRPPSPSRKTFSGALESLIRVGGDTDTNASIFGQVCGAIFGLDVLPTQTVELDIDGEIGRIARDLTEAIKRSKRSLF